MVSIGDRGEEGREEHVTVGRGVEGKPQCQGRGVDIGKERDSYEGQKGHFNKENVGQNGLSIVDYKERTRRKEGMLHLAYFFLYTHTFKHFVKHLVCNTFNGDFVDS